MNKTVFLIIIIIFTSYILEKTAPFTAPPKGMAFINADSYRYADFPEEDSPNWGELSHIENFEEGGLRYGKIIDGYKEGKWLSVDVDLDTLGNLYATWRRYS